MGGKNGFPEKVRKEVDKKTSIIFNYNSNTYEYDNNDSIDEEDELLRDVMELEQKEKMEKNKLKISLSYRIKPYICPVEIYENSKKQFISCSKEYYSNIKGPTKCIECPAGIISNIAGVTSCTICTKGDYENIRKECISWSKGYYSNKLGLSACSKGYYSNIIGGT